MNILAQLDPPDERRMDALIGAVTQLEARGLRIVNVKITRSFYNRLRAAFPYASMPPQPGTFRGYQVKIVEDSDG